MVSAREDEDLISEDIASVICFFLLLLLCSVTLGSGRGDGGCG